MQHEKLKLGVLISGSGTNLQALIDACATKDFPAQIVLVLSNKADAGGLARAARAAIPSQVISHKDFASRELFDASVSAALRAAGVEFICLAGFMRLLTAGFAREWHNRLINIHPSLLPDFKGTDSVAQALAAGVKTAGCTVHFVRPEMDSGPIIVQTRVPVVAGDTVATLHARIQQAEHQAYPKALRLIATGKVTVKDELAVIDTRSS